MRRRITHPSPAERATALAAAAAAAAVALVLLLAATTSVFESTPASGAYDLGFEAGFVQVETLNEDRRTRVEAVWFARGVEAGSRPVLQTDIQAARLVALYAVTTAISQRLEVAADSGYDAGYAQGRDDARAGRADRFADSPTN